MDRIAAFRDERDWKQFHSLKNLAISLQLEAAEVLEIFQWRPEAEVPDDQVLKRELADVLYWVLLMAHDAGIDLASAFEEKMQENAAKYPVDKAKGSSAKYTEYQS